MRLCYNAVWRTDTTCASICPQQIDFWYYISSLETAEIPSSLFFFSTWTEYIKNLCQTKIELFKIKVCLKTFLQRTFFHILSNRKSFWPRILNISTSAQLGFLLLGSMQVPHSTLFIKTLLADKIVSAYKIQDLELENCLFVNLIKSETNTWSLGTWNLFLLKSVTSYKLVHYLLIFSMIKTWPSRQLFKLLITETSK